jgi:Mlc titration factor MtfA (ptsG expression regulator)
LPVSDPLELSSLDGQWAALPLDPYAGQDAAEFFACASEAFFEAPARLGAAYPAVYEQLSGFFRQDPLGAPRSASIFASERR